jgi:hypothetical protein
MPYTDGTPAPNDEFRRREGLEPLVFDKATGRQVNLVNRNGVWVDPAGAQKLVANPNNTPITGLAQQTYDQGGDLAAMAAKTREPGYGMPAPNIMNQTPNLTGQSELSPGSMLRQTPQQPVVNTPPPSIPSNPVVDRVPSFNAPASAAPAAPRVNPKPTGATNFKNAFTRARAKRATNAKQY